jgi:mannose/fructose/N-acetylgalactosamine-specific phosphotransferase system component IID
MNKNDHLKSAGFIRIFIRSFFIQAVWNYQSMISIGFCYALAPVAKKLFADKHKRSEFINRHLNFFNAHPYFSSFALGAIARVEEDLAREGKDDYYMVDRLKNALIGPLGAIGDQLVWATLKPASILVGLFAAVVIEHFYTKIIFLIVLLALYNIPHIYIRIFGLFKGYRAGFEIYKFLNLENFKIVRNIYGSLGALALGTVFSYCLLQSATLKISYAVVYLICFLFAYYYKKLKQSVYRSLVLPVLLALLLGIIIENI